MTKTAPQPPGAQSATRPCIVVAADDAGMRTGEGYVARSLLSRHDPGMRVILNTRHNNVAELRGAPEFLAATPNPRLVGYDLPRWAAWWKAGPRGYGLHAYLRQLTRPFVLKRRRWLARRFAVVHTLNFHNHSIPGMAWILGRPTVWGPINHNQGIATWLTRDWPARLPQRDRIKSTIRQLFWRPDPVLAMAKARTGMVQSAGSRVDRRLRLEGRANLHRGSQPRFDLDMLPAPAPHRAGELSLASGGRLDWVKGRDLALEALARLPEQAPLTIIGDGPGRDALAAQAERLGLPKRVTFRPAMPRKDLLQACAEHDLFLVPSAEAGRRARVETLATGLPVVGFEGPSELPKWRRACQGSASRQSATTAPPTSPPSPRPRGLTTAGNSLPARYRRPTARSPLPRCRDRAAKASAGVQLWRPVW